MKITPTNEDNIKIEEEPKNEDDHIKRLLKKGRGTQK